MRIAFVSTILDYPWGGADVLWTRTAAAALARGDAVLVAVSPMVAAHHRVLELHSAGAALYERKDFTQYVGWRSRWRQAFQRHARSERSLTAALDSFRPDFIVICEGGVFDFLIENGLLQWIEKRQCPFAFICQSNDERDQLSSRDQSAAREVLESARHTFFVSTHNRDHAGRQSGASIPRASIVFNPIELPFEQLPLGWPVAEAPRLAVVARLEADVKGLDVLIEALGRLSREGDWKVNVFGRGPDQAALEHRAGVLGVGSRLSFCGFEPNVLRIWAAHHVLLVSSRREGCALAMLEALACGRPVITTDVGGAQDWIEPGVNGWIHPPGDVSSMAGALDHALGQFSQWSEMGTAAAESIRARHDMKPEVAVLNALERPFS